MGLKQISMRTSFLVVALTACAAVCALAAGDEDPVEVLMRVRDQVMEHALRIPKHTCVEAVQRDRYEPALGRAAKSCDTLLARRKQADFPKLLKLDATDRLRLDVAMASDGEMYYWAGDSHFQNEIDELIPDGPIGTGPFAALLLSIFEARYPRFLFQGETNLDGRALYEYTFQRKVEESHYRVKAHFDWLTTGYTATLLVDPRKAELVRLSVRTEELPEATGVCETDTTLDYGMVPMGGIDYLLPKTSRQRFIGRDGAEAENNLTFTSCREYKGESTLHFGDAPAGALAPASEAQPSRLPAGLQVTVELTAPIRTDLAWAGDAIEGRLAKPVRDTHDKILLPEGAKVEGRLMRVEIRHSRADELILAMRLDTVEVNGVKMPLVVAPRRRVDDLKIGETSTLQKRGIEIELPLPGEIRYGVFHFPGDRSVVESGFRTEWTTVER